MALIKDWDLDDDLKRIASRIRTWRDEAGMTLQQLGDQSGVSASTIHKIENLQTVPTIAVLLKVANGLDRRPSELLAEVDTGSQVSVLRSGDRQELTIEGRAKLEHLAPMIPRNRLDVWKVDLEPNIGAGVDGQAWEFNGEIILMVEEGELEFDIAGEAYKVGVGDSIHFDTSLPHRWYASGGQRAQATVFALLPDRLQGDLMNRIAMSSGIASAVSTRSQES
jgi:transcriptional regulator with XRE-family HTH domain